MEAFFQFSKVWIFLVTCFTILLPKLSIAIPLGFPLKTGSSLVSVSQTMLLLTGRLPDPRGADVNNTRLLNMLGDNFDSRYMSVDVPTAERSFGSKLQERSIAYDQDSTNAMSARLRKMHFKIRKTNGGKKRLLGERASAKLRQWLWELSRCPVQYKWIDIGKKFFPRYIREGSCSKKQCSFPKGMSCKPASKKPLKILIWLCFNETAEACGWRPLLVGTITTCKCGCQD